MTSGVRPFRPLGARQLEQLAKALEKAHADWQPRWFTGPSWRHISVHCEAAKWLVPDEGRSWVSYSIPGVTGKAYLALPDSFCMQALQAWTTETSVRSLADDIPSELASRLVCQILGHWLEEVRPRAARAIAWEVGEPAPDVYLPFGGAVCAQIDSWFGSFFALFDGDFVASVLPRPQTSGKGKHKVALRKAIGSAALPVTIRARAFGGLSLDALRTLSAGDVLLLENGVSDPWTMTNAAGEPIAQCSIGRSGDKRAVILTAPKEVKDVR